MQRAMKGSDHREHKVHVRHLFATLDRVDRPIRHVDPVTRPQHVSELLDTIETHDDPLSSQPATENYPIENVLRSQILLDTLVRAFHFRIRINHIVTHHTPPNVDTAP